MIVTEQQMNKVASTYCHIQRNQIKTEGLTLIESKISNSLTTVLFIEPKVLLFFFFYRMCQKHLKCGLLSFAHSNAIMLHCCWIKGRIMFQPPPSSKRTEVDPVFICWTNQSGLCQLKRITDSSRRAPRFCVWVCVSVYSRFLSMCE